MKVNPLWGCAGRHGLILNRFSTKRRPARSGIAKIGRMPRESGLVALGPLTSTEGVESQGLLQSLH